MKATQLLLAGPRAIGLIVCAVLPAILAPGQTRYSENAIGYVDVQFAAGSNLVSNSLNAGENTMERLFPNVPNGTFFLPWDTTAAAFTSTNVYREASGWTDPSARLVAPNGGFLWLPEATTISFVGVPWAGMCVEYPAGECISSVAPEYTCAFCGDFQEPCPAYVYDGTIVRKWSGNRQDWDDYVYVAGFGWFPSQPTLGPGEAVSITSPNSFGGARMLGPGGTLDAQSPISLRGARRNGSSTRFEFTATNSVGYTVLHCADLGSGVWQALQNATTAPTNGSATVTVETATNQMAFYRLLPWLTLSNAALMNPLRSGTTFRFELYAPATATYDVEKASMLTGTVAWQHMQSISTEASNVVSVTDAAATNASAYYRVRY